MTLKKQLMCIISGRPAANIRGWVQEGGCPQSAKAQAWPYRLRTAFRGLGRKR